MMKTYRYITYLMLLFAVFAFAACDDDESGQPVIERVRLTDPDKADSTFTEAYLGQMILIEGHDLDGARNIYINNQDCYFNSNYNTSSHIIMTIPSDLVVYGQDNSLPMEIRVETTHGSATYSFHVIADFRKHAALVVGTPLRSLSARTPISDLLLRNNFHGHNSFQCGNSGQNHRRDQRRRLDERFDTVDIIRQRHIRRPY